MGTDVVGKLPGEVTIVIENELECMNHDAHKLHHLQCGQVLLPPEEPTHKKIPNGYLTAALLCPATQVPGKPSDTA